MQRRNLILLTIFGFFVLASGFVLYRSFSSRPLTFTPTVVSTDDVQTRSEVEGLKIKIHRAVGTVDTGGELEQLTQDPQFKTLTVSPAQNLDIGAYGRTNPFLPVK
ncbi:MAG: hypothetical protein HY422_01730 [Candidatus Komeilibacteria bacterium]|nr:hypothetical protein [Candidatus Komeilibacteria bacterium]